MWSELDAEAERQRHRWELAIGALSALALVGGVSWSAFLSAQEARPAIRKALVTIPTIVMPSGAAEKPAPDARAACTAGRCRAIESGGCAP